MIVPVSTSQVYADNWARPASRWPSAIQSLTYWSPFGPQNQQLLFQFYSDFGSMLSAAASGQVDMADWPIQSLSDFNLLCANPDMYCTLGQSQFGGFINEINSHPKFMGTPLFAPRATTPASFTLSFSTAACAVGSGSLTITLSNQETGSIIKDANNTLIVAQHGGSSSTTISDMGDPSAPSGQYQTPCLPAGLYNLRTSIYGGAAQASISSTMNIAGTLNVNWNSISTSKTVPARAMLGAAIGHLIDVPAFVIGLNGGLGDALPLCIQASASQRLSCPTQSQLDTAICEFGNHAAWLDIAAQGCMPGATGHAVSGTDYRIGTGTIAGGSEWWQAAGATIGVPAGYAGHDDLRAACENILSMNSSFTIAPSGSSCNDVANAAAGTIDPGVYQHIVCGGSQCPSIVYYVRTGPGLKQFGTVIADELNFLFGTPQNRGGGTVCWGACPNATPRYYTVTQVTPIVFQDEANPDAWQLYTAGNDYDPNPTQFFSSRNSVFSGGVCGGKASIKPGDYDMWCDPEFDTYSSAGEFSSPLSLSYTLFQRAAITSVMDAIDTPVFSFSAVFAENNGWNFQQCNGSACANSQSSVVNALGYGAMVGHAYFSFLNMRQVPGYNPCSVPGAPANCASFWPGGGPSGTPGLLRRGLSQDTRSLSPFTYSTPWEADIVSSIYDSMLKMNPMTGGPTAQLIDWGARFEGQVPGVHFGETYDPLTDVTTQNWQLRPYWKFQDNNPVTVDDVAYSILAYRDVPSVALQSKVVNVLSVSCLDCSGPNPTKSILQVKLAHQSAMYTADIGGLPILEKKLWTPYCGDPPIAGGTCADPSFDPFNPTNQPDLDNALGIMIGSGPWTCIVPSIGTNPNAGHLGGPCSENANNMLTGQAMTLGARVLLQQNVLFIRCCPTGSSATTSNFYKLSWVDRYNSGNINLFDLASAARAQGTTDTYWCNTNIPSACINGKVTLFPLAYADNYQYLGEGATAPYPPLQLTGLDLQIDPFFCPIYGC